MQELSQDMPSSLPSPAETDRMPSPPPANLMKRKREADDEAHEQTIASEHSLSPPADSTRRRSATPPRNQNGLYTCTHPTPWPNCADMTFRMPCEYRKHMNKHERPFQCSEPACAELKGFTYQGGLLRHEREVHGKSGGPKEVLNCPIPYCKRHTGPGFTRRENLNEHIRRLHRATEDKEILHAPTQAFLASAPAGVGRPRSLSVSASSPASPLQPAVAKLSRKRRSSLMNLTPIAPKDANSEPVKGAQEVERTPKSASSVDTKEVVELRWEIKRLRTFNAQQSEEIARLYDRISRLEDALHSLTAPSAAVYSSAAAQQYGPI